MERDRPLNGWWYNNIFTHTMYRSQSARNTFEKFSEQINVTQLEEAHGWNLNYL